MFVDSALELICRGMSSFRGFELLPELSFFLHKPAPIAENESLLKLSPTMFLEVTTFYSWAKVSRRVEAEIEPRFFKERDIELSVFIVLRLRQKASLGEQSRGRSDGFFFFDASQKRCQTLSNGDLPRKGLS